MSAPYLIATKLEAFHDRGGGDVLFSRDLGDIVALVDGRVELADEVRSAEAGVRGFIAEAFRTLLDDPAFVEALPAHLMPDAASQTRAPLVAERMRRIVHASSEGHAGAWPRLEAAYLTAGATAVANARTNGTLAFDAPDPAAARRGLEGATAELGSVCGLLEPACVRSLVTLKALPWETVFAGIDPGSVFEFTVSFSCSDDPPALALPLSSARGDAVVLWAEGGDVLSVTLKIMAGPGSPDALLERTTRTPFTSRSLGTIQHILAKYR